MINKVMHYAKKNNMIEQGDRIVVGVSGGADSVCLLYVLRELCKEIPGTLIAVHINHGIRGKEADRDEQFVRELCQSMGILFRSYAFEVKKLAKEKGLTEEEAGRNVRYEAFLEECKLQKCNKIAVAHNKNDNAETVLFHLFRGTGMKGLSGIEPTRIFPSEFDDITVIRPLLCIERKEIEEYLGKIGISYQTDSTNLTEEYSRNKIRNKILAYAVEEINSGAVSNINETAVKLREALEYIDYNVMLRYQALVRQEKETFYITVRDLLKEPAVIQKGILRKIMENLAGNLKDLEAKHVEAVLSLCEKQVGRYVHLPYRMLAEREYEEVKIFQTMGAAGEGLVKDTRKPITVIVPGRTLIPGIRKILETKIVKYEKNEPIPKSSCMKWFDYDKIENVVEIRNRREGDYIQINSLGGRKKLKDYFIDCKVPQKRRDSQMLITDGSHVMWIPEVGERISERYKVEEATTNVLLMKMIDLEEDKNDR